MNKKVAMEMNKQVDNVNEQASSSANEQASSSANEQASSNGYEQENNDSSGADIPNINVNINETDLDCVIESDELQNRQSQKKL